MNEFKFLNGIFLKVIRINFWRVIERSAEFRLPGDLFRKSSMLNLFDY